MNEQRPVSGPSPDQRRTLLARLLAERATSSSAHTGAPLSFSQQRLWFFDQLTPGTAAYNIPMVVTFDGPLDVGALERSVGELLRRHDVLRTTVTVRDGVPFQIVAPWSPCTLALTDVSGAGDRAEADARDVAEHDAREPFDLARGPLFRARLIRVSPTAHRLAIVVHHIVADAWSMGVIARDLTNAYESLAAGRDVSLPDLPMQYADFARWQHETAASGSQAAHLAYWKQRLAGAPPTTELPPDHSRRSRQTFRGAAETITLSPEASATVKALARRHGATLFMTALAALKLLIFRLTGQTDLVIGAPIAGRTREDTAAMVGCFINALALRTDLSDRPTFEELLRRVREACLGAYAHQELPFEKIVEELQPRRDLARPPLFQIVCNLIAQESSRLEVSGLRVGVVFPEEASTKYDATLYLIDGQQISLRLAYNADLFERERMAAILRQFEQLLAQVAANPGLRVTEHSLVALPQRVGEHTRGTRDEIDTPGIAAQLQYWTARLAGGAPLDLPFDRRRPAHPSRRRAMASRTVDAARLRALRVIGQNAGVSLVVVLLAAFKTLLSRYTEQDDVIVGSPAPDASDAAARTAIGGVVNTLALRTDLSDAPTFLALLGRVRNTVLEAYERADVPFDTLIETMSLERGLSCAPLVQVFFTLASLTEAPHSLRGPGAVEEEGPNFDLSLHAIEQRDDLLLRIVYAVDLFDASTIEDMLERFELVLQAIATAPERRVSELPLMSDVERLAAVSAFNAPVA